MVYGLARRVKMVRPPGEVHVNALECGDVLVLEQVGAHSRTRVMESGSGDRLWSDQESDSGHTRVEKYTCIVQTADMRQSTM